LSASQESSEIVSSNYILLLCKGHMVDGYPSYRSVGSVCRYTISKYPIPWALVDVTGGSVPGVVGGSAFTLYALLFTWGSYMSCFDPEDGQNPTHDPSYAPKLSPAPCLARRLAILDYFSSIILHLEWGESRACFASYGVIYASSI